MSTVATLWVKLGLDSKGYSQGLQDAATKTQDVGKKMMGVGTAMTAGLTLPIVGAGFAAMNAASDLEESMNAVNVVYGESAAIIADYADTVATTAGLSKAEFAQLSAVTGAFLKNVGFDAEEAANQTIQLTERASDMASIFNTDVTTALSAIQSGLKGEFNPLEQFGVKMKAAMIEAKALSMGLVESSVSMQDVSTAQSKLGSSQDKLNKLADEALKTGKLTVNQAQELKNAMYMLDDSTEFGKEGTEGWNASIESALGIWKKYSSIVGEDGRKAILGYADGAEKLETALAGNTGEITDAMKAQAALALVMEQTDQFAGDFANTSDGLANSTKIMKAQFTDAAAALGTQLLPIGLKIVQFLSDLVEKFSALNPEQQKTMLIIGGVVAAIGPLVTIVGGLITAFGAVMPVLAAVAGVLTGPVGLAIAAIIAIIALLKLAWDNNFGGIQEKTAQVFAIIQKVFDAFKAAFAGDWTAFGELLREAWDMYWTFIVTTVKGLWAKIGPALKTMANNIIDFFNNIDWANLGRNIVIGIGNGIASMATWIWKKAQAIAGNVKSAIDGFFGNNSPSRLMLKTTGPNIADGLIKGFENTIKSFNPQMAFAGVGIPNTDVAIPKVTGISEQARSERHVTVNIENVNNLGDVDYVVQEVTRGLAQ